MKVERKVTSPPQETSALHSRATSAMSGNRPRLRAPVDEPPGVGHARDDGDHRDFAGQPDVYARADPTRGEARSTRPRLHGRLVLQQFTQHRPRRAEYARREGRLA